MIDAYCRNNLSEALCESSANSNSWDVMAVGKSFINSREPSMLPWGTPERTSRVFDRWFSTETHQVLFFT